MNTATFGAGAAKFVEMTKGDAEKAAYRIAATQLSKGMKAAIVSLLQSQGTNSDTLLTISELLDTEMGAAIISLALGMALTYTPKISDDPRVMRIAREFRVNGISKVGDEVLETTLMYIVPVIQSSLEALPQPPAAEVEPVKKEETRESSEEEEVEAKEAKRMRV